MYGRLVDIKTVSLGVFVDDMRMQSLENHAPSNRLVQSGGDPCVGLVLTWIHDGRGETGELGRAILRRLLQLGLCVNP